MALSKVWPETSVKSGSLLEVIREIPGESPETGQERIPGIGLTLMRAERTRGTLSSPWDPPSFPTLSPSRHAVTTVSALLRLG